MRPSRSHECRPPFLGGWSAATEDTARQFGDEQLALVLGLDNPDARRLYERLGYADWRHRTVVRRPGDPALGVAYLNSIPAPGIEVRRHGDTGLELVSTRPGS
jgi:hypothetical protein